MVNGINVKDVNVMLSLVLVLILWIVTCKMFWNKSKSNQKAKELGDRNQPKNIQQSFRGTNKGGGLRYYTLMLVAIDAANIMHALVWKRETDSLVQTDTKTYRIKPKLDKKSEYVIYLGTCLKC